MAERIEHKKKKIVSTRQLYRQINIARQKTWEEIKQKQISQKIQNNYIRKYERSNIDVENIDNIDVIDNIHNILDLSVNSIENNEIQNVSVHLSQDSINFNHIFKNNSTNVNQTYDCMSQDFNNERVNNTCNNLVLNQFLIEATHTSHLSSQNDIEENLSFQLRDWAVQYKISQAALNNLLKILIPLHSKLPLDSRTLLKTTLYMPTQQLEKGELCYMGISQTLKQFVSRCSLSQLGRNNIINISFNIDGLPLFKSSNIQLWPILGLIKNCPKEKPFVIAIYCGTSKPSPLDIFLKDFVNELCQLLQEGFLFEDK